MTTIVLYLLIIICFALIVSGKFTLLERSKIANMPRLVAEERAKVLELYLKGLPVNELAKIFNIHERTVYKVIKRLQERDTAEDGLRSGRKRKTDVRTDRLIVREAQRKPDVTAREIKELLNIPLDVSNIRRRLRQGQLYSAVAKKRPFISDVNRKKRLLFAKKYYRKPIDFWKRVLWTDESKFEIMSSKRRKKVWKRVEDKGSKVLKTEYIQGTVKHGGGSVMAWGCFSFNGVGKLKFIESTFTATAYIELLEDVLIESVLMCGLEKDLIFMQDNDPKHVAKKSSKFFRENLIKLLDWPPQSPDLNPMEHLWDELERRIPKSSRTTKSSLRTAIETEWAKIDPKVCQKLVESIPKRLQAVIRAKGGNTLY